MAPLCINIARSQRFINVQLQSTKMWKSCYLGHNKTTWYSTGTNYSVFIVMTELWHNLEDSILLIHWSGQSIQQKANVKSLGVIFDQHVTWINQRNNIIRSTHGTLRVLWKFRKFTPTTVRKTLAKALILSKINYCNMVYGQLPKHLINRLQRVQNTTAGYVYGSYVKRLMQST